MMEMTMWPYTQDEVRWLALPHERAAAEQTQRAIEFAWMKEIGMLRQPANDSCAVEVRMVDPRR
jgi:hypothetical protein